MKEKKGKIFNSEEVQAIIAGNKTMFREVCKIQPKFAGQRLLYAESSTDIKHKEKYSWANVDEKLNITHRTDYFKQKFQVGQEIFVKEAFVDFRHNNSDIFYKSDFEINNLVKIADLKWNYARSMKQEQSRLTLKIKSVKVEKLRDISEEDCIKEGTWIEKENGVGRTWDIKNAFFKLWNSTHKKQEHKWEANPWVFAYEFEVINN